MVKSVCGSEVGSDVRRIEVAKLLLSLSNLPGVHKSSESDYAQALDLALERVPQEICSFDLNVDFLRRSLERWLNKLAEQEQDRMVERKLESFQEPPLLEHLDEILNEFKPP